MPDIKEFMVKYKNQFENPVVIGYIVHLLTDYFFNHLTFKEHFFVNEEGKTIGVILKDGKKYLCDKEEMREIKQKDFNIYSKYLIKCGSVKNVNIKFENIENYYKAIDEIPYKKEDVLKIINYLSNIEKNFYADDVEIKENNYKLYSRKDFDFYMNECVSFIIEKLELYK